MNSKVTDSGCTDVSHVNPLVDWRLSAEYCIDWLRTICLTALFAPQYMNGQLFVLCPGFCSAAVRSDRWSVNDSLSQWVAMWCSDPQNVKRLFIAGCVTIYLWPVYRLWAHAAQLSLVITVVRVCAQWISQQAAPSYHYCNDIYRERQGMLSQIVSPCYAVACHRLAMGETTAYQFLIQQFYGIL